MIHEIDLQRQIVGPHGIATMLGWVHVHFRPAMTKRGWRTPGTGELAKGWPDLTLVRERDSRLIFAELKRELAEPDPEQDWVLGILRSLETTDLDCGNHVGHARPIGDEPRCDECAPLVEVYVWRPSDIERIAEILR